MTLVRMAHPTILFAATIKGCLKAPLWQSESIFRQPFVVADVLLGFGKKQIAVNGVAHNHHDGAEYQKAEKQRNGGCNRQSGHN
jgi:hypothetical protein